MTPTFYRIGRELIDRLEKSPATIRQYNLLLKRLQPIHDIDVAALDTPQLYKAIRAIEADGARQVAHRCVRFAGYVMRYARAHGLRQTPDCSTDLAGLLLPQKSARRAAVVTEAELRDTLRRIEKAPGGLVVRTALMLLPHVFVRPAELTGARWAEFDLDRRIWTIPAERMKMRRPHVVPLSTQTLDLLARVELEHSEWVLPGRTGGPICKTALGVAMVRAGVGRGTCTPHGWRATASTLMGEQGEDREIVELQLAHKRPGVQGLYDRSQRLEERAALMQRWSDYLVGLTGDAT